MKTLFSIVVFLLLCAFKDASGQLPHLASGRIDRYENFASAYVQPRNVDVWLPDNYDGNKRYSVLYMHDGQMLFDSTLTWNRQEWGVDETLGTLLREKRIRNCIVVAIWNNGAFRFSEYFPQKVFFSLSEADQAMMLKEGRTEKSLPLIPDRIVSDSYLKFIVSELKPFIDKTYKTFHSSKYTMIAGSSMGGLISLYAVCEYPEVFGGAACLSTHWPGLFRTENNPVPAAMMAWLAKRLPSPRNHKLYFDYGTRTLDALYKPYQLMADELIRSAGYHSRNWTTREFAGKDHSERAWKERFQQPILFLLSK